MVGGGDSRVIHSSWPGGIVTVTDHFSSSPPDYQPDQETPETLVSSGVDDRVKDGVEEKELLSHDHEPAREGVEGVQGLEGYPDYHRCDREDEDPGNTADSY